MKLQRTPLILLITALLFSGAVYFYEAQVKPQRETAQTTSDKLFSFKESDVQTLTLTTQAQTLSFAKSTASPSPSPSPSDKSDKQATPSPAASPAWKMTAPKDSPASDASVSFLLNLMAIDKSQQTLTVPATQQAEFGFDKPLAIVEVKLNDQKTHRLILGKPNYNRSGLYAQVDPPASPANDMTVRLVSLDFENAVTRPLSEWQSAEANKPSKDKDTSTKQSPAAKSTQSTPSPVDKNSEKKSAQPSPQN